MDNELLELIDALIEVEGQMNLYYQALTDFLPEHKVKWIALSKQEYAHAAGLAKIRQAIRDNPSRFAPGKCTPSAARMIIKDSNEMIKKIIRREVHPRYAISFITDIERSTVEANISEAIRTDVDEIRNILERISKETVCHRDLLRSIKV